MSSCFDLRSVTSREFGLEESTLRVVVRTLLLLLIDYKSLTVSCNHGLFTILSILIEIKRFTNIGILSRCRVCVPPISTSWRTDDYTLHLVAIASVRGHFISLR